MRDIKLEWFKKADNDGLYAIAYALIGLTEAIEDLGFHRGSSKPGCFEKIAIELERIANVVETGQ